MLEKKALLETLSKYTSIIDIKLMPVEIVKVIEAICADFDEAKSVSEGPGRELTFVAARFNEGLNSEALGKLGLIAEAFVKEDPKRGPSLQLRMAYQGENLQFNGFKGLELEKVLAPKEASASLIR